MTFKNIAEAEAALLPYVPLVAQVKIGTTLDRVWPLMALLGNPQDQLKVIHIAGTSGKTSTAYYLSALLSAAGQKVGLTVSPHVDSITERVQINGQPLEETEFCAALGEFLGIVNQAEQSPSYFELLYAFAIWVFAQQGVDYAVVETGMGGLLDATNVARRPDKVCVITDIGLDHTHVLGDNLREIALQKAGIIYEGNHVFSYRQPDKVMSVIEQWAHEHQGILHIIEETRTGTTYQQRNWQLAFEVSKYLQNRDKLQHLTSQVLRQTKELQIPARMEARSIQGKTVVMDGAHNEQKMTAFVQSFQQLYPGQKPAVLIALKKGKEKDHQTLARILAPLASRVIATTFQTSQDLPAESVVVDEVTELFRVAGVPAESMPDQSEAVQALLTGREEVCIVTGSFYLLSQLRNNGYLE